jgi:hypothetical protein
VFDLIKYELPRIVVRASRKYLGADWQPSGDGATIYTDPVSPGRQVWPVGLEIDPDVAPHLMVNDVKVGRNSQLVACGSIPATLFADPHPVYLRCDQIHAGLRFSLQVSCLGLVDVELRGRLLTTSPDAQVPYRSWVVGFGYTEVRAGQTVDVVTRPQVDIHLQRLHVPPHLLDAFRVDALFQGPYLDVAQASRVADFRQLDKENLARGGGFTMDPSSDVGVGSPVTVTVTNVAPTTQYFCAALVGEPVARSRGAKP